MYTFEAGKGINAIKLNANFTEVQGDANTNEIALTTISNTALLKDGSNITQTLVDTFNTVTPIVRSVSGNFSVTDNKVYHLTLTGNTVILLPTVATDANSHTIIIIVQGSLYSLNLGTSYHLLQNSSIDTNSAYSIMYVYNKVDNHWYYCITQ